MRSFHKARVLRFEQFEIRAMLAATGILPEDPPVLSSEPELALASSGDLPIADAASIDDTFNDGVFNADGQWDPQNITQGGQSPAHILYDEATSPGAFRVTYYTAGIPQTTLLLRKDASLQVGDYAQVDVAFAAGPNSPDLRIGVGLASSRGRNADGGLDRGNVLYWGLRNDGRVRGHYYGANGTEIGDGDISLPGYTPGKFITVAIQRSTATSYKLYMATTGQPLQLIKTFTYTGSTGAGEIAPTIPGIFLDDGLASFIAVIDNFRVDSGWPPPINPARINVPQETVPLPANQIALDLTVDSGTLPQLESAQYQVNFPQGNGDNTYHHGALLTKWHDKLYLAWHSTPQSEVTYPYTPLVSMSLNGENWSTPVNVGAAGGDIAYASYIRAKYGIPVNEAITLNSAPRNWHATDSTLYLWSLGWVTRANGSRYDVGRIWFTTDGQNWQEIAPQTLDGLQQNNGLLVRDSGSNRGFIQLKDGRLMAATLGPLVAGGRIAAPITSDPTGLSGWSGGVIDTSLLDDVGEPTGWQGSDGTLHYAARGNTGTVWHAYSTDGGQSWSKLESMGYFPDSPSNKQFGVLSNGWNWYVGNPVPGSRTKVAFSVSRDGWLFDRTFVIRDEPITPIWPAPFKTGSFSGYEYPAAYYDESENVLYVAYSRTRDYIEVSKITGANLIPHIADFNYDGIVDFGDYNLWKTNFGASAGAGLQADASKNTKVDAADYVIWRNNLGTLHEPPTFPSGSVLQGQAAAADTVVLQTTLATKSSTSVDQQVGSDSVNGEVAQSWQHWVHINDLFQLFGTSHQSKPRRAKRIT
jgi:hypothetical protein